MIIYDIMKKIGWDNMVKMGMSMPNKMIFVGNYKILPIVVVDMPSYVSESYKRSTIPTEIETLLRDCKELEEMNQNTVSVEKQISARLILLKEEMRTFVEQALDVPVTLDGELLTYETNSKEEGYTKRTIYQLDVDEESMLALIRFINSKKTPTADEILMVLKSYETAKDISFGYRTSYLTSIDEKAEVGKNRETTVYTGTIFNNTEYSLRTRDLMDKISLKILTDYVSRTGSTYSLSEYVIKSVDDRWLIVHEKTGATDLLTEAESSLCKAVSDVQSCLDGKGILANNKKTDFQIETLQSVLEEYLKRKEEKQK